ncbi:hypothetical protein [Arsenicicoccus piscis]|uniref:hypothetical protein n=1 Tax=Arsenicicoccus piscis TaxID=673954 RepID=UPI003B98634E
MGRRALADLDPGGFDGSRCRRRGRRHHDRARGPPYGEVLRGVLDRDLLLSVRDDFVAEAWRIVDPVLESWRAGERPLDEYPAGSTGPVRS